LSESAGARSIAEGAPDRGPSHADRFQIVEEDRKLRAIRDFERAQEPQPIVTAVPVELSEIVPELEMAVSDVHRLQRDATARPVEAEDLPRWIEDVHRVAGSSLPRQLVKDRSGFVEPPYRRIVYQRHDWPERRRDRWHGGKDR